MLPGPTPGKSVAYWGPPIRQGSRQPALTFNMGTQTNVEKLDFAFDAQAAAQVSGAVADPDGEVAAIYKKVARDVAVKIAQQAKDFSSKFPTISISKNT